MKAKGFTLLEILVALAVFGLLLVGLSQTVRFGLTAWRQEARLAAGKTDLEAVDRTIRTVVENLAPGDDSSRSTMDGTPDSVSGVTVLRVPGSGQQPVAIEAGLAVSGRRLVLRWRLYHHGLALAPAPPPTETELMSDVGRLGVEYWRPPGVWVSQWHEPDLPRLIRFHLTSGGSPDWKWPDIVVAPLLSRP